MAQIESNNDAGEPGDVPSGVARRIFVENPSAVPVVAIN